MDSETDYEMSMFNIKEPTRDSNESNSSMLKSSRIMLNNSFFVSFVENGNNDSVIYENQHNLSAFLMQ